MPTGYNAYGATAADFVAAVATVSGSNVLVPTSGTLTVWNAPSGGTQITDLKDASSSAISTVTYTNGSIPRFYAPVANAGSVWIDISGVRVQMLTPDATSSGGGISSVAAADITDSGSTGIALIKANSAVAARTTIGSPDATKVPVLRQGSLNFYGVGTSLPATGAGQVDGDLFFLKGSA